MSDELSTGISNIYQRVEDLQRRCESDPGNALEVLSDALSELQISLEELSAADEELCQQNEELIQANEALQQGNARYKSLAENVPSVLMRYDRDFRVVYLSPQAEKITGIPADQFIGKTNREVGMPKDLCDKWENAIDRVFRTGANHEMEFEFPATENSGPRTFYLKFAPEFAPDGTLLNVLGISTDITEIKHIEAALKADEERFHSAFEGGAIAMALTALDGRMLRVNSAFSQMLMYDPTELAGHTFADFTHPDDLTLNLAGFEALTSGNISSFRMEKRYLRKDGQIVWGDMSTASVRDSKGMPLYFVTNIQDITERKRAELALQESEEKYRTIVETANEGIWVADSDTKTRYVNRRTAEMLGYSPEEMIGKKISEFMDEEGRAPLNSLLERRRRGIKEIFEHKFLRKNGSPLWVLLSASPLLAGNGKFVGFLGMLTDITDRKRAEEELNGLARQRRLALDAARMGWWHYNPVTRISSWDDLYGEIFGVTGNERPNDEILAEIIHPEDLPDVWAKVEAALDPIDPQPYSAEYRINRPDGSVRWIEAHGIASFEGVGDARRATSLVGTVADITDRKQSETERERLLDEAQAERDRVSALVASMQDEVWFADTQKRFTLANPTALKEFGLDKYEAVDVEEFIAGLEVLQPDGSPRPVEEAQPLRALKGEVIIDEEEIVCTPASGELRYRQVSATPIRDKAGQIIGSVSVVRDITERKQAEEALRETKDYLESLIDYANAPIIVWDTSFKITRFNHAFEQLTGLEANEVIEKQLDILFPEESKEASIEHIRRTLSGERWEAVEIPILRTDGSFRTVLWNSANIYDRERTTEDFEKPN